MQGMTVGAPDTASSTPDLTGWLTERLQADFGFQLGAPLQAEPLAQACSVVLWKKVTDARATVQFEIVCFVDREKDPERVFSLSPRELAEIGNSCLPLAGKSMFGLVTHHLRITVVEVAARPLSDPDRKRLQALNSGGTRALRSESAYLDAASRSRWSSSVTERLPFAGLVASSLTGFGAFSWSRLFEDLMHERARLSPGPQVPSPAPAVAVEKATRSFPVLTTALVAFLVLAFVCEAIVSHSLAPDPAMLLALGGMNGAAVRQGEWFRLISASMLHAGIVHIALNCLALYLAGAITEWLVGAGWLFVIYASSAALGSVLGVILNSASVVSVGASGAIMGLLAASFALSFRLPKGVTRTSLQSQLARFLIPSLLPLAATVGGKVDYTAHFGGAIAGIAIGLLLLALWGPDLERPPLKRASVGLAVLAGCAFAVAAAGVVRTYPAYAADAKLKAEDLLVPDGTIPTNNADAKSQVETWGKGRPRDPRVHLFRGMRLIDEQDLAGAEREFRAGLAESAILQKFFGNRQVEILLRGMLSAVLIDQGKRDDAEREAEPVCHAGEKGAVPDILQKLELCGAMAK